MLNTISSPPVALVLLATYNGGPWLREQLDSILAQQGVDLQVRLGDDCSKDDTLQVISDFAREQRTGQVECLGWSNSSGSAGANFRSLYVAADLTGIDYVALADQDDIWYPDKITRAIERLRQDGAQAYSSAVTAFWPDGRERVLNQSPQVRAADFLFEGAGQGCTFVMEVAFFKRVQRFCVEHSVEIQALHYHDWLVYLLARAWGVRWVFDPVPGMRYRQHGGNEIGARGGWGGIDRRLKMIRNGWFAGQVEAALQLWALAGGQEVLVDEVGRLMCQDTAVSRIRLALLVAGHSRRRGSDRAVLAAAALAGWMHSSMGQAGDAA